MENGSSVDLLAGNDIDIRSIIEDECEGFTYGDMTSVRYPPTEQSTPSPFRRKAMRTTAGSHFHLQRRHAHL